MPRLQMFSAARSVLSPAARTLARLIRTVIEGPAKYHPEQHYMRGPGPKWREKHMFDITTRGA